MAKKRILITVSTWHDVKKRVISAVKRLEAGLPPEEPIHRLSFTSQADLFRKLSPKRLELLRFLKKHGPLSRRQLAIKLNRAYANVHDDVNELLRIDLAKINREKKLFVPWDEIDIALPLAA